MKPNIKPKKAPKITAGAFYTYDPDDFIVPINFHLVTDFEEASQLASTLVDIGAPVAIDTESMPIFSGPVREMDLRIVRRWVKKNPQDVPFGVSISDGRSAWFVRGDAMHGLKLLIEEPSVPKILHNAKFDMHMLENIGMVLGGYIYDTLVITKLVDENRAAYTLEKLSVGLKEDADKYSIMKDGWLRSNKVPNWSYIPVDLMTAYACSDTYWCYQLFQKEYPKLLEYNMVDLYDQEERLLRDLYAMERVGFKVEPVYLTALKDELEPEMYALEAKIYDIAGGIFNANSVQQLHKVLIDQGLPAEIIPVTDKGNPSLTANFLEAVADRYPIAEMVVELRNKKKLVNTYIKNIVANADANDRIHVNFNQTEAVTGRMSATDVSIQNMPVRRDDRIRGGFIPAEGYSLFMYDYSQVEYKIFIHFIKAAGLMRAVLEGYDIHRATAAMVAYAKYEDVTPEMRQRGKTTNFALIYGQGDKAFAGDLGTTIDEARMIKRQYFEVIPEARSFVRQVHAVIRGRGYIVNPFKRRRTLVPDHAFKAPNALIQGTAADVMKRGLIKVATYLRNNNFKSRVISVVHDELFVEQHHSEVDIITPVIVELLSDRETFRIPITAGCEFSPLNWANKKRYDLSRSYKEQEAEFFAELVQKN